ncbi:MAG: AI-2E family transporter [Candidatus Paceibacterota bacterium]
MDKDIRITIASGTFVKLALILILLWLVYVLRDLALVVLTAIVFASAIEPATLFFVRHKIPRTIAVLLIYFASISFIAGALYLFIPPLVSETSKLLNVLPSYIEDIGLAEPLAGAPLVGDITNTLSLRETLSEVRTALASFSGNIVGIITSVFGGLFGFILILVISFYLAVQRRGIDDFIEIITPARHERYVIDLWRRSQRKIGLWMQGQLLLGLIVGVLVYLGLTIIGVPYALTLAVLAALFELIPLFGPILAAVPAVAIAFLDSVTVGFMTLGLYAIIQQFENHLIYPLVVRKVVGVSPIVVILALIIGGKLAGFLGVLLAVPVAAALMEFADDIQKGKRAELEKVKTNS